MLAVLQFVFSSFWTWLGSMLMLNLLCMMGIGVVALIGSLCGRAGGNASR